MDFKVPFSQLVVLYEKLTKQQKMIIAAAVIGIVAFLIFMVVFSASKNPKNSDATSFDKNVKYIHSLENELSRTVNDLTPIKSASVSKVLSFSQTYLAPFFELFKYLLVLILLLILYKKVISPFAFKMFEISKKEKEFEPSLVDIHNEEEDLVEKIQQMRKKVESQLGIDNTFNEDELKYRILLEKVRDKVLEEPEKIARLLESLLVQQREAFVKKEESCR